MQSYNPRAARHPGLGSSRFARHYSGNHYYFIFLQVLRCFSSLGWLPDLHRDDIPSVYQVVPFGNPGIYRLCAAPPWLIAAYHVLLRLLESRHPPYALNCFKKIPIVSSHIAQSYSRTTPFIKGNPIKRGYKDP